MLKKLNIISLVVLLLFPLTMPMQTIAAELDANHTKDFVLLIDENNQEIPMYESSSLEKKLTKVPNNSKVKLLEFDTDSSKVQYEDMKNDEIIIGYVPDSVIYTQNMEPISEEVLEDDNIDLSTEEDDGEEYENAEHKELVGSPIENKVEDESDTSEEDDLAVEDEGIKESDETEKIEQKEDKGSVDKDDNKDIITDSSDKEQKSEQKSEQTTEQKSEQTTEQNTEQKSEQNDEEKQAARSLMVMQATKATTLYGFALKDKTNVYISQSTKSKVLKSYPKGSKLKYSSLNKNWYAAKVYVDGKYQNGYIHKNDVAVKMPTKSSYAQKSPTHVYASTSKSSKSLKSYPSGHLLKYHYYNSTWYETAVYVNGKRHTGYIYRNDVGEQAPTESSYAQKSPTHVYASTSKSSKSLKSYPSGHLLKYHYYNSTWYETSVYVNGKRHTGYIYRDDVGKQAPTESSYAQKSPTHVYASPSKSSKSLKSYRVGHLLKYHNYNSNWYETAVYVNGKRHIGYIYKDDVGDNMPLLYGFAKKKSTHVYSSTSSSSKVLKSYKSGHLLKYRPYNNNWYKATVYLSGIPHTGYIKRSDTVNSVGKTVIVDAGHGGYDPGAVANGLYEKDINLELALDLEQSLKESGFNVVMTRSKDVYISLSERSKIANKANADLFVSIHVNSGGGTGIETYWYDKHEGTKSKKLAENIQNEVIKETKTSDRGVKYEDFHVNRETKMPSALLEVGFIDNSTDAKKLKENSYKNQITRGLFAGIKKFFSLF